MQYSAIHHIVYFHSVGDGPAKKQTAAPRIRPENHDIPRRRLQQRRHAANGSGCSPPVDFPAVHVQLGSKLSGNKLKA